MAPEGDCMCTVLTSAGVGAILAVIGMTLWNRRNRRVKNENRKKPWSGLAKLYHTPSFTSSRCTWLLEELGVRGHVDIQPYNPHTATAEEVEWYTKNVNPSGLVPALQVEGVVLTESSAICMYLAAAYDALLPPQSQEHNYYNWITHAAVVLDPVCRILYRQMQKTPSEQQDAELITSSLRTYAAFINTLNEHLANNEFLCGKKLTAADIMVGYNVMWVSTIKGGLLLQDYQHVKGYLARLKKQKGFQAGMGTVRDWVNTPQWEASPKEE